MKVPTAVATHDFELAVDGFDDVGCGKGFAHVLGIFQKSQIVFAFFAQFGNPGGIGFAEAIAEFLKLVISEIQIPAASNRTPTLLKLDSVWLGEMRFSITLHVNDAKLHVGIGEQAFGNRQQTTEVIVDDDHDATKAALNQSAQDQLPIFEIFTTWSCDTRQDLFFPITA